MTTLAITDAQTSAPALQSNLTAEDQVRLTRTVEASLRPKTRSNYASAWRVYNTWLTARGYQDAFSPEIVAAYLAYVAERRSPSSVDVARAAILDRAGSHAETLRNHEGVRVVVRGTRRLARGRHVRQARALSRSEIRTMVQSIMREDSARSIHDRALLLLGLAAGVRSSELVGIRLRDVEFVQDGISLTIAFSKVSDDPQVLPIVAVGGSLCPVSATRALVDLLNRLGINDLDATLFHPVRRGGNSVNPEPLSSPSVTTILTRIARDAGVSTEGLRSHSLRSTYCTMALQAGFSERDVARGRWAEGSSMLQRYDRRTAWQNPASGWLAD